MNNTQSATTFTDSAYPKADRVAFAYYRGRILLYQRRLPQVSEESIQVALCLMPVVFVGPSRASESLRTL